MNRLIFKHLFFILTMVFPSLGFCQSGKMLITNSSGVSLQAEPVVLTRKTVESFVEIPTSNSKAMLVRVKGKDIPAQLDDLDRDGQWDELAFQLDIERNSSVEIRLKWIDTAEVPRFDRRVMAFLGVSDRQDGKFESRSFEVSPENWQAREQPPRYHLEGPVWENDKVGFRYFFDSRHRPEFFGKRTTRLILDSIGLSNTHFSQLQNWGMRVFDSDAGLGIGGLALVEKGEVFPIRKSEPVQFIQIANGPCRAMFDLVFENWKVNGNSYQLRQRISIWTGKYGYKNEIMLSGFTGPRTLAVGIGGPKVEAQPVYKSLSANWSGFFTHGRQSENGDVVGLGFLMETKGFDGFAETQRYQPLPKNDDSLSHSHFVQLKVRSGVPTEVYVFGAWEKTDLKFGNTRYFLDLLQEEADRKEVVLIFTEK